MASPPVAQLVAASCRASLSAFSILTPVSLCPTGQSGPASRGHPQLDPWSRQSPWCLDCHRRSGAFCGTQTSHWLSVRIQPLLLRSLLQCDNPVCGFIDTLNPLYVSPQSVTLYGSSMLGGSVPAGQPLEIEGASQPGLVTKNGLVLYGTDGKPVRFAGVILK